MNEDSLRHYLATGEAPVGVQDEAPESSPIVMPAERSTAQDKAIDRYLKAAVEDAEGELTDLQKHDRRFHPNGYKKGDKCKYREQLEAGDNSDAALAQAEQEEQKDNEIIEDIKTTYYAIPNENEAREKFLEFARNYENEGDGRDIFEWLEGLDHFAIVGGRRKNELVLQYFDPKAGYRQNPRKNILSWRPKNVPRKKPEPKKAEVKETKKASYTPSISLSGALPFPDMHFVVKEPGSREVMMSDGTFKPYEKLSGWDHPLMTTKEHAEEVAKEKGGAAVSDKYLRDTAKRYWIRDNDRVLNSYSAWGPTRYEFENLGNLDNDVFKTSDLDLARKIAAEHGGEVEEVPDDHWDDRYYRRVYKGYEDVPPQQTDKQKAVQAKLQPEIDAILRKHNIPVEETIILRKRLGGSDEFSIAIIGKMDEDAQSTPEYIYLDEGTNGSKTIAALRDISDALDKAGFKGYKKYNKLSELSWRKEKLDDGTLVFYQNFSSPEHIQKMKERFG